MRLISSILLKSAVVMICMTFLVDSCSADRNRHQSISYADSCPARQKCNMFWLGEVKLTRENESRRITTRDKSRKNHNHWKGPKHEEKKKGGIVDFMDALHSTKPIPLKSVGTINIGGEVKFVVEPMKFS